MTKKGFKTLPLICWGLAIVVTALVYWLLVDDLFSYPVKWLSVCFVLLAEIIMCLKFVSRKQSIIMNTQGMTGGLYLVVVFVLSLIYVNLSEPNIKWFIAIHAILLLVLAIADLTILNFEKRTSASDTALAKNQSVMAACGALIDRIIAENADSEFSKDLSDISEAIRYSDNSLLSGDESDIMDSLKGLKEALKNTDNEEDISAKIKAIKALIKTRSIYIKQNQRGKF